ncbi:acyl carrier protein [Candidatus Woesearchaeota archaeon]|nr:acyl carrier protein [Candidatus Woesearchaeota archaeon]
MENLKDITARVLNIDLSKVNDTLVKENTEQWDSFNHLLLISEIEKKLGIKFTASEIEKIRTFKDLSEVVSRKRQGT